MKRNLIAEARIILFQSERKQLPCDMVLTTRFAGFKKGLDRFMGVMEINKPRLLALMLLKVIY